MEKNKIFHHTIIKSEKIMKLIFQSSIIQSKNYQIKYDALIANNKFLIHLKSQEYFITLQKQ